MTPEASRKQKRHSWYARWVAVFGVIAVGVICAVLLSWALAFVRDPLGLGGGGDEGVGRLATGSLSFAEPTPWDEDDKFLGYARFTAEYMNEHRDDVLRRLIFVGPDAPSTGPHMVSVNPIDDFRAAAALSRENGACYAIVAESSRRNPEYGGTKYGIISEGSCTGRNAPSAATHGDWPGPYED